MLLAKNNELRREVESSHASLAKLQHENSALRAEYSSSKEGHENIRRELAQERLKSAELESKTANLRSMLIPTNETQLSDGEVIAKFASLRSQILKLVKTVWSHEFKDVHVTEEQSMILSPFATDEIDLRYLDNRLRGVVFSILNDQIFGVRHYGLDEKRAGLSKTLRKVESLLCGKLPKGNDVSAIRPGHAWLRALCFSHSMLS